MRIILAFLGGGFAVAGLWLAAVRGLETPSPPPSAVTTAGELVTVVDGDTVDIGGERFRLMGYDTPEIYHAQCGRERDLGLLAAARLIEVMQSGPVTVVRGKGREKYGRGLARISVGGQDVGETLISEGRARAYDGKSRRRSWCE